MKLNLGKFVLVASSAIATVTLISNQQPAFAQPSPAPAKIEFSTGVKPILKAQWVDEKGKAQKKTATVEVTVEGLQLIDPDRVGEKPVSGQGHLHYQIDNDYVIATTATKLSFHQLSSGTHTIKISASANDHSPLGPQQTLTVTIP